MINKIINGILQKCGVIRIKDVQSILIPMMNAITKERGMAIGNAFERFKLIVE